MKDTEAKDAPLEYALDDLMETAGDEKLRLGDMLDAFEDRSLGFILVVFGIITAMPVIGAIPGLPNVSMVVICTAVFHSLIGGQQSFWAPDILRRQEVSASPVRKMLERLHPVASWVDNLLDERLAWLVDTPAARVAISITAALMSVAMAVLAVVPFGAVPAALGIVIFGLALMGRDGVVAGIGYLFAAGTAVGAFFAVQSLL